MNSYGPIDDGDLFFFSESLTFTDPSIIFGASIVFFIRSFMTINVNLTGFGVLLFLIGWFVISGFIQAILGDVALFVTSETMPFFAQLFHIFWGCGASPSLGSVVSICQTIPISPRVHSIWMRRRHLDFQDLGQILR